MTQPTSASQEPVPGAFGQNAPTSESIVTQTLPSLAFVSTWFRHKFCVIIYGKNLDKFSKIGFMKGDWSRLEDIPWSSSVSQDYFTVKCWSFSFAATRPLGFQRGECFLNHTHTHTHKMLDTYGNALTDTLFTQLRTEEGKGQKTSAEQIGWGNTDNLLKIPALSCQSCTCCVLSSWSTRLKLVLVLFHSLECDPPEPIKTIIFLCGLMLTANVYLNSQFQLLMCVYFREGLTGIEWERSQVDTTAW